MNAVVVVLSDACSAAAIVREVLLRRGDRPFRRALADCAVLSLRSKRTVRLSQCPRTVPSTEPFTVVVVGVGVSPVAGARCYVALPGAAQLHFDYCYAWARYAHYEQSRQYAARCKMAVLQSVGGGWAALRRADKALQCALMLFDVALQLRDEETLRKCRVFVGWAHVWSGDIQQAVDIFEKQRSEAVAEGDIAQERRCIAALAHVKKTPSGEKRLEGSSLAERWVDVFA